jgi:hypothetical protein
MDIGQQTPNPTFGRLPCCLKMLRTKLRSCVEQLLLSILTCRMEGRDISDNVYVSSEPRTVEELVEMYTDRFVDIYHNMDHSYYQRSHHPIEQDFNDIESHDETMTDFIHVFSIVGALHFDSVCALTHIVEKHLESIYIQRVHHICEHQQNVLG